MVSRKQWTKEEIIETVKTFYREGKDLRPHIIGKVKPDLYFAAYKQFGSWRDALEAAGINYDVYMNQKERLITGVEAKKTKIIAQIRQLYKKGGAKELRKARIRHRRLYLQAQYWFGGWIKAVEAAGFNWEEIVGRTIWTPERVLEEIRTRYERGEDLRFLSVRERKRGLINAACKYFGSWKAAIKAAGLDWETITGRKWWTPERVIEEIRALSQRGEDLGFRKIRKTRCDLVWAACRYFGKWKAALEAAGIDGVNKGVVQKQNQEVYKDVAPLGMA